MIFESNEMNEERRGNSDIIVLSGSRSTETRCRLVEILEKDAKVLRIEARYGRRIGSKLENKLDWYHNVSETLSGKVTSLRSLAKAIDRTGDREIKLFADRIEASWRFAKKQIYEEYSRIRVASRTLSGTPLTKLLINIRKRTNAVRVSLRIDERPLHDEDYISNGIVVHQEIEKLLNDLENCDEKVQQYLAICKLTPHLVELDASIEKYVARNNLIPENSEDSSYSRVFSILGKFLTGELLGREPMDPNEIVARYASRGRGPVFITKNNKRKINISDSSRVKIRNDSRTYLSSFP